MLHASGLQRALGAGTTYFLGLFALGFVLGTIRIMVVAPRWGDIAATLAEVPVMLAAGFFVCRWAVWRWQVPYVAAMRWMMVLCFVMLLLMFETVLGAMLFGRTLAQQLAALTTSAGLIGLAAQIVAALFPLLANRRELS